MVLLCVQEIASKLVLADERVNLLHNLLQVFGEIRCDPTHLRVPVSDIDIVLIVRIH